MHGAILNGFLSHFVGMHFPGVRALLQSVELRFLRPCYLWDHLKLELKVVQKSNVGGGVLLTNVAFRNVTRGNAVAANGRVQIGLCDAIDGS